MHHVELPILRQFRPQLDRHLSTWNISGDLTGKRTYFFEALAPYWIRETDANNRKFPLRLDRTMKQRYTVQITDELYDIYYPLHALTLDLHMNAILSRILMAMDNGMPVGQVVRQLTLNGNPNPSSSLPILIAEREAEVHVEFKSLLV